MHLVWNKMTHNLSELRRPIYYLLFMENLVHKARIIWTLQFLLKTMQGFRIRAPFCQNLRRWSRREYLHRRLFAFAHLRRLKLIISHCWSQSVPLQTKVAFSLSACWIWISITFNIPLSSEFCFRCFGVFCVFQFVWNNLDCSSIELVKTVKKMGVKAAKVGRIIPAVEQVKCSLILAITLRLLIVWKLIVWSCFGLIVWRGENECKEISQRGSCRFGGKQFSRFTTIIWLR